MNVLHLYSCSKCKFVLVGFYESSPVIICTKANKRLKDALDYVNRHENYQTPSWCPLVFQKMLLIEKIK